MNQPESKLRIPRFVERYGVDTSEMMDDLTSFSNFNEFFIRRLKPEARPIDPHERVATFPADGRHLGFQNLSEIDGVFVKGQKFDIDLLLMNAELANPYREGTLILSRLCPVDYHRFHFPVEGLPSPATLINGPLHSVNPIALRRNLEYLWTNKRVVTRLETERFGVVLLIEIGATCVGTIRQSFEAGRSVKKGQEKGWFEFGGSSTITLFEPGRIRLANDLLEHSARNRELYARMGDRMGELI